MKKKLLWLSTLLITTTPIITVVSCGDQISEIVPKSLNFIVKNDSKDISDNVVNIIEEHFHEYVDESVEAQAIKDIHIFDETNSPFLYDEGDYVLESNELVINTAHMAKYTNFKDDDKANYIMQLLAHEYNHYVDHSYLLNIDQNSEDADKSIHDWNNKGNVQPWPKLFLNEFKSILHYDDDTDLYSDSEVSKGFVSLGSVYNQKELFEMSNGIENPSTLFEKLKGNEVMSPLLPKVIVNNSRVIKKDALSYLYSMDELFARKMQIITSAYHQSTNFDENGYFKLPESFTESSWESPYLQDIVNYQRGLNDFTNNGQYLFDKPTEQLSTLYNKVRGIDSGHISFIEIQNNKYIKSDGSFAGNVDRSVIRFGGTIQNSINSNLKFIGYIENNKFVNIPIKIVQRKNHGILTKDYLSSFFEANKIIDKQLFFAEDDSGKNKLEITETRNILYGLVSTHRYLDPIGTKNFTFNKNGILSET